MGRKVIITKQGKQGPIDIIIDEDLYSSSRTAQQEIPFFENVEKQNNIFRSQLENIEREKTHLQINNEQLRRELHKKNKESSIYANTAIVLFLVAIILAFILIVFS